MARVTYAYVLLLASGCYRSIATESDNPKHVDRFTSPMNPVLLEAPPSSDWSPLDSGSPLPATWNEISCFVWNWEICARGDRTMVCHKDIVRHQYTRTLPYIINKDVIPSPFIALKIEYGRPRFVLEAEWIVARTGFEGADSSVWWIGTEGKRFGKISNHVVTALYNVPGGVLAIGKKVLLISVDMVEPNIDKVTVLDGTVLRSEMQEDGSILVLTYRGLWRVEDDGNARRICNPNIIDGIPRTHFTSRDGKEYVFTTRGLWRIESQERANKVCDVNTDITYPAQLYAPIYEDEAGDMYVGLIYYLLKLKMGGEKCQQEWYVPTRCTKMNTVDGKCFCKEGELSGKPCSLL